MANSTDLDVIDVKYTIESEPINEGRKHGVPILAIFTLLMMFVVIFGLIAIVWQVLSNFNQMNFITGIASAILIGAWFGLGGLKIIGVGNEGVPKVFGAPIPWFSIKNGYCWILPWPFMELIEVNTKRRSTVINTSKLDKTQVPKVTCIVDSGQVDGQKNKIYILVEVDILATVYWQITDPYTSVLAVEQAQKDGGSPGDEMLDDRMRDVYLSYLRQEAANEKSYIQFLRERDQIAKDVNGKVNQSVVTDHLGSTGLKLVISQAIATSPEMRAALEGVAVEMAQRQAELVEAEGLKKTIRAMTKHSGNPDGLDISDSEALFVIQAERGKNTTRQDIHIDGVPEALKTIARVFAVKMKGK